MLQVGIVGLPNVGKSTLFNALLKKRVALSANYPFATIEPNTGVVEVPDERLGKLAELVKQEEKMALLPPLVPAVVEFVDIAGLVKGASQGEGLGNQFLSHIREVDAIIHVLRDFSDSDVVRAGSIDPSSDKGIVETELALSDLQTLEKLISAQEKDAKFAKDLVEKQKLQVLIQLKENLNSHLKGVSSNITKFSDERLATWYAKLPLLSLKPVLYVYNVSEGDYAERLNIESGILNVGKDNSQKSKFEIRNSIVISAKLEEELADLTDEERKQYLQEMGIEKTGLERLIQKAYAVLGLLSFLTAGPKEVRAWTIPQGTKAPQAAGVIHTDFEKGVIRAEVVTFTDLISAASYAKAKESGKLRLEGKDYIMKDGDVVEFRVNT